MVEIIPTKGTPWLVNLDHTLTLARTQKKSGNWGGLKKYSKIFEEKDVSVRGYLGWSKSQKNQHVLFESQSTSSRLIQLQSSPTS